MRIIARRTLIEFCNSRPAQERASALVAMAAWHAAIESAEWASFADVKKTFNTADWVGNAKVVFDVGGNKYRIVGLIGFRSGRLWVLFVGTHAQYDAIDVTKL
ncbi:type II toxin-antitoxin system HigB family toxin [Phenylobacterium sp.]|uniref:type II toxin-antitoxin system HigB family toxin n=1 Tax=Phenylobacterium sp. TaxID=1871053 RepID=UPI00301DBB71